MNAGSAQNRLLASKLSDFLKSCEKQMAEYFGYEFYNADIYRIAEFVNGRRVCYAAADDIKEIKELMKKQAFATELESPME